MKATRTRAIRTNVTQLNQGWAWINVRERIKEHPTTFGYPSPEQLAALKVGDYIKLGVEPRLKIHSGERFWVEIMRIDELPKKDRNIFGRIDQDLGLPHGLSDRSVVQFQESNILSAKVPTDADMVREGMVQMPNVRGVHPECNYAYGKGAINPHALKEPR